MLGNLFRRHWFLLCLAVVVTVGFVDPRPGLAWRAIGAVPLSVAFLMFLSGLMLETSALVRQAFNFRLIVSVFASVFIVFPLVTCGLANLFRPGDGDFLITLLILAAQPSTLASGIVMTRIAGGDEALAVVSAVSTNLSSVVLTPLIFSIVLGSEGRVTIATEDMIGRLARIVLIPVAAGQLLRFWVGGRRLVGFRDLSGLVSQVVILGMILTGISGASGQLAGSIQVVMVAFGLHLFMLLFTYAAAKLVRASRGESIALVICGSQKTLPAGIYIWSTYFSHVPIGSVAVVAYHVVQMIVDSILVVRIRDLHAGNSKTNSVDNFSPRRV